jgi:hypothetical protein
MRTTRIVAKAAYSRDSPLIFIVNGEIIHGREALRERQRQLRMVARANRQR